MLRIVYNFTQGQCAIECDEQCGPCENFSSFIRKKRETNNDSKKQRNTIGKKERKERKNKEETEINVKKKHIKEEQKQTQREGR